MTGFNLPPGCNVSDLPGNTPEDVFWGKVYDDFWDKQQLTKDNLFPITDKQYEQMDKLWKSKSKANRDVVNLIDDYIYNAIAYGVEIGRKESNEIWKQSEAEQKSIIKDAFKSTMSREDTLKYIQENLGWKNI